MRVVFVTNEPLLPVVHGGRKRMLGLAAALGEVMEVHTAEPTIGPYADDLVPGVERHVIDHHRLERSLRHFASGSPRLGSACFDRVSLGRLASLLERLRPDVLMVSHSYLAPVVAGTVPANAKLVVDFPNVETDRLRSLSRHATGIGRASALWESSKALLWEPRTARRAGVCVTVDETDQNALVRWGALQTCIVPNSTDHPFSYERSPHDGPALFLGSGGYGPNASGGRWLCDEVWPAVLREAPDAELWIAGWGTESTYTADPSRNIRVLGAVDDLSALIEQSAVCLAPVHSGAGTQLKLLDVLARHRVVVATRYSGRSIPAGARDVCHIADDAAVFAAGVIDAFDDVERRWGAERTVAQFVPVWRDSVRSLVRLLGAS